MQEAYLATSEVKERYEAIFISTPVPTPYVMKAWCTTETQTSAMAQDPGQVIEPLRAAFTSLGKPGNVATDIKGSTEYCDK
jgi:hypothetical protein